MWGLPSHIEFPSVSAGRVWIPNDLSVESTRGMGIGTKLLGEIKALNAKSILSKPRHPTRVHKNFMKQPATKGLIGFFEQVISDNKD